MISFVKKGYEQQYNIQEKQTKHCSKKYHKVSTVSLGIVQRFKNPQGTIPAQVDNTVSHRHEKYPQKAIARNVHLLGCQGLSFRGHREEITNMNDSRQNPWNFIAILSEIVHYNPVLEKHMNEPTKSKRDDWRNRKENDSNGIIEEIKVARFHLISTDEVTESNDEI